MTTDISRPARENNIQKRPKRVEGQELILADKAASMSTNMWRNYRYDIGEAIKYIHDDARDNKPDFCPYADPLFWAGFQIIGR